MRNKIRQQAKRLFKKIWFFRAHPYVYMGVLIKPFLSKTYIERIEKEMFVIVYGDNANPSMLTKIMLALLVDQYYSVTEDKRTKINKQRLWGGAAGKNWFTKKAQIHSLAVLAKNYSHVLSEIRDLVNCDDDLICEVGTGTGWLLEILSDSIDVKKFIGLDINQEQILENKRNCKKHNIEFVCAEASAYIEKIYSDNLILVTTGTLMYFSTSEIYELLTKAKERFKNISVVISESTTQQFEVGTLSIKRGLIGFHHNYLEIFRQLGYTVLRDHIISDGHGQISLTLTAAHGNDVLSRSGRISHPLV